MTSQLITSPETTDESIAGAARCARRPKSTWMLTIPWELSELGGVNQVVENLFDITESILGHTPLLLINGWGHSRLELDNVDGRRTVRLTVRNPIGSIQHGVAFVVALPSSLLRLRRLLVTERITRINVHYPGLDTLTWLLARRLLRHSPVLVLSFHGTDVRQAATTRGVARRLWSILLRRADHITVCSEELRASLVQSFGSAAAHAIVIHNGVDPRRIAALACSDPGVDLPREFVLSLATIERKKGLDTLIRSFAAIESRNPQLALVISGRVADPEYLAELQELRRALPCADRILILPGLPHDCAMGVLARSRALVLASRQEPFGIVILEAAVLEVPVTATTVCGAARLLGDCLLTVPPDDVTALASSLERLLADRQLATDLAQALKARVLTEFTWERIAAQYAFGNTGVDGSQVVAEHPQREPR